MSLIHSLNFLLKKTWLFLLCKGLCLHLVEFITLNIFHNLKKRIKQFWLLPQDSLVCKIVHNTRFTKIWEGSLLQHSNLQTIRMSLFPTVYFENFNFFLQTKPKDTLRCSHWAHFLVSKVQIFVKFLHWKVKSML